MIPEANKEHYVTYVQHNLDSDWEKLRCSLNTASYSRRNVMEETNLDKSSANNAVSNLSLNTEKEKEELRA